MTTLAEIAKNLNISEDNSIAIETYKRISVEAAGFVKVGDKYLTKELNSELNKNRYEDDDTFLDDSEIKENEIKKANWGKVMKQRLSLNDAFNTLN